MTTLYSTPQTYEGISYRAKLDYTVTIERLKVTINTSCQLQYKGTYKNSGSWLGAEVTAKLSHTDKSAYVPIGEVDVSGTTYGFNATNFPSKSSWTNKGSALSKTHIIDKKTESYEFYIEGAASTSLFATSSYIGQNITIPALQNWSITYKNNDGTSNSFYSTIKYDNIDKTFPRPDSSVIPVRSGFFPRRPTQFSSEYILNTSSDGSGTAITTGSSVYSDNAAIEVYLMWDSYINYDGNGISLPSYTYSKQIKHEHESRVLNSNTPTRSGYIFKEWNTAADGTGDSYDPGDTYSQDVGEITLYAIWLTLPQKPQIGTMTAIRSNSQGQQDDTGTYGKISVDWSVDTTSEAYPNNTGTVTGTITPQSTGVATSFSFSSGASGTSGTAIALIPNLDTDEQYTIKVTVTDQNTSTSKSVLLTRAFFIMDFKAGGQGIGIGRAAPNTGIEIGYKATFDDDVTMYEKLTVTKEITSNNGSHKLSSKANVASPEFTGTPKAPTPTTGDNSTKIATTAFVKTAIDAAGGDAGTATPTANKTAKFDSNAKMNSTDMTTGSGSEIETFLASLNLGVSDYIQRSELKDYVIGETTNDGWTYRLWVDGVAECWKFLNAGNQAMTTAEGSGYYAPHSEYSLPSILKSGTTPIVNATAHLSGALGGFALDYITNTQIKGYWWATRSVTKACYLNLYVIGLWK